MDLLKKRREMRVAERENREMARLALVEGLMVPAPQPTREQELQHYITYRDIGGIPLPIYEVMLKESPPKD